MKSSITIRMTAFAAFVLAASPSTVAQAVNCTIQGTLQIQPLDTYYCDSNIMTSCAGWNEVDLDGTKPLRNIAIGVRIGGVPYAPTMTNSSGAFSMTLANMPNCTGTVDVITYFMRPNPGTSWQIFKIVNEDNFVHTYTTTAFQLTGATTNYSYTITRANYWLPYRRVANVYYTVDSALTQMRTWSTNLANRLGGSSASQEITVAYYEGQNYDNADDLDWGIKLGYGRYTWGANTRHELGHMVHQAAHHQNLRNRWEGCVSLRLNRPGENAHGEESCEYASAATYEALATFFAIRSIVAGLGEDDAFWCFGGCNTPPSDNQDFCSDAAMAGYGGDRNTLVPSCADGVGWWTGVGDTYSAGNSRCVRLIKDQGCAGCPDTNADNICDWPSSGTNWNQVNGFRNETNTFRYFWDVLDEHNEGGLDDTDWNITSFIAGMEAMLCGTTGGIDGTCNEPNPSPCNPTLDWLQPATHTSGDRDSYNVQDLDKNAAIPGNQDGERLINCLSNAPDLDP